MSIPPQKKFKKVVILIYNFYKYIIYKIMLIKIQI